jgi:endonuclease/exonuclease/phosphatase family metal-dependent hydrolase
MKLLSWNVQWCRGVDGRVDPERIAREARAMADADVICLQEVARHFDTLAGSQGEDQFQALAAAFPGYTAIEGIAVDVPGEGGATAARRQFGNLLLSRLPLRQAWRHLLPWPADASHADMQRVAIEVVVEAPDVGDVRVTTTHLAYYSAAQRLAQVDGLRELHATAQGHGRPPERADVSRGPFHWRSRPAAGIVTGDFNCEPGSPGHARMLAPFDDGTPAFRDAWAVAHGAQAHAPTVGLFDTVQWPRRFACDFVFVSADLAPRVKAFEIDTASSASDHQAQVLTLGA